MKNRRRRLGNIDITDSTSRQLLGLSLFIMLLAFFILLNAISSFQETKVRPVTQSLNLAFASRLMAEEVNEEPSESRNEEKSVNEGSTVERLEALFTAQIPSYKAVVSPRTGTMHVRVPFEDFEEAVLAMGQPSPVQGQTSPDAGSQAPPAFLKGFFLPTLVALVRTESTGTPYRMDILLAVDENPAAMQNRKPKEVAAHVARLSRLTTRLEQAGLPARLVSAGLHKGEAGFADILFKRHVPFDPGGGESAETDGEESAKEGGGGGDAQ